MARPRKNNAEYFTHDADMRNDIRIKALRRKCGLTGYAIWCLMLEVLTDNDYFEIEWNEINLELLSADFDIEIFELNNIVSYCIKLDLLQIENNKLCSNTHKKRFNTLISKRERDDNYRRQKAELNELTTSKTQQNKINDVENHIVKESKVKESKVNKKDKVITNVITLSENQDLRTEKYDEPEVTICEVIENSVICHDTHVNGSNFNSNVEMVPDIGSNENNAPKRLKMDECENINYKDLITFFNSETKGIFGNLRYPINDVRKTHIKARIREHGKNTFAEMIRMVSRSDYLKGNNKHNFKASFDWMIKPSNFTKIIEGNYENRGTNSIDDDKLMQAIAEGRARGIAERERIRDK